MHIRPATPEDIPALGQLMRASMAGLGGDFYTPTQTEDAAQYLTIPDPDLIADGTQFIVELEGQMAGTGGWSRRKKLFTGSPGQESLSAEFLDPATDPARIRAYFVHPNFARRGVARALYQACETAALAYGFKRLALMATLPGVPLYRALGFEALRPVEIDLPNGRTLPCLEMERAIE